jgi:NAD(P)H-flavin reductase
MHIIIYNKIYDITTFIAEHPGGIEVFKNLENSDITEQFNEIGHSSRAVSILSNYKIGDIYPSDPRYNHNISLKFNQNKITKLVTHEDKYNIHKICGIICLINFIYMFIDFALSGFVGISKMRPINIFFMFLTWIHMFLSLSSLQFNIPKIRTGILPMIWQEFRLHNIIFAMRSIVISNVLYFFGYSAFTFLFKLICIMSSMYLADTVTKHLSEYNESTTATMPYWSGINPSLQKSIKYFYSHAQIAATLACLFGKIDIIMYMIFPIQIASFLMTLVRKNIISTFSYHLLYALSLFSGYLINYADVLLYKTILLGAFILFCRTNLKINKYLIWANVSMMSGFLKNNYINTQLVLLLIIFNTYMYLTNNIYEKKNKSESNNVVISNEPIDKNYHKITIRTPIKYDYLPGQYFNLYYDNDKRPYTPINIDTNNNIQTYLIKKIPNGYISPNICNKYYYNSTVFVKGPFGTKLYDNNNDMLTINSVHIKNKNILMFCCGSGITPFYSIKSSQIENSKYNFKIFWSIRDDDEKIIINDNYIDQYFVSENKSKLIESDIIKIINDFSTKDKTPYICICGTNSYQDFIINVINIHFPNIQYIVW